MPGATPSKRPQHFHQAAVRDTAPGSSTLSASTREGMQPSVSIPPPVRPLLTNMSLLVLPVRTVPRLNGDALFFPSWPGGCVSVSRPESASRYLMRAHTVHACPPGMLTTLTVASGRRALLLCCSVDRRWRTNKAVDFADVDK